MAFITQAGPLPALLEKASDAQRERAAEVRNALAAKLGANGKGLHVGLWLVSASAS